MGAPGLPWNLRLRADSNLSDQQITTDENGAALSPYSATFTTPVPDYPVGVIVTFKPA